MIRRILVVAAAAVALILAPSVASGYPSRPMNCTVSDSTPTVGSPVTVTCSGAVPGETLTLTVNGTPTRTATADATGVATFTVSPSSAGSTTLVVKDASGAVLSTQVLGVSAEAAPAAAPLAAPLAAAAPGGAQLSRTGFDGLPLAVGGGVLVLLGAGAVLAARRRRSTQVPG